ncbi:MAG: hypothetical protein AAFO79_05670 [Pseudomonadota bacterium]
MADQAQTIPMLSVSQIQEIGRRGRQMIANENAVAAARDAVVETVRAPLNTAAPAKRPTLTAAG